MHPSSSTKVPGGGHRAPHLNTRGLRGVLSGTLGVSTTLLIQVHTEPFLLGRTPHHSS